MPRKARLDAPGVLHHVMVRGIEKSDIFQDDADRIAFLSRIGQLVVSTRTRIPAWALMPNHVHLLLFSGPQGISQFMRRLLTGYALYFNRRHHRSGHLFQNRYRSIVCEEEAYLLELVRYIHLNPLRGDVVGSLKELEKYPWSGHAVLMGLTKNDWQEKDYILRRFHRERTEAVRAYAGFVADGEGRGRRPELTEDRNRGGWSRVLTLREDGGRLEQGGRVLGDEDFVSEILRQADDRLMRQLSIGKRHDVMHRVIRETCADEEVNEQELRHGGQRRKVSELRARIAWRLSREWGISMAEIARQLGVSTSGIANAIRTMERKVKSE